MGAITGLVTVGLVLLAPMVWGQQPDTARGVAVERGQNVEEEE